MRTLGRKLNPEGIITKPISYIDADYNLIDFVKTAPNIIQRYYENVDFQEVLIEIWRIIQATNKYINDQEPWVLKRNGDLARLHTVLYVMMESVRFIATLLIPVMPQTCEIILDQLNVPESQRTLSGLYFGELKSGILLGETNVILFQKVKAR